MKDLATWIKELGCENASIYISTPYLTLLNYVSTLPRTGPAIATQFMLMSSKRRATGVDIAPVFLSSLHPLE